MLIIRLSRHWRKKDPFYRIVLTEHTKSAKSWYQKVLWWFNPLEHKMEVKVDEVNYWISKWSQMSSRVAKLMLNQTKDEKYKKFIKYRETQRKKRKSDDAE